MRSVGVYCSNHSLLMPTHYLVMLCMVTRQQNIIMQLFYQKNVLPLYSLGAFLLLLGLFSARQPDKVEQPTNVACDAPMVIKLNGQDPRACGRMDGQIEIQLAQNETGTFTVQYQFGTKPMAEVTGLQGPLLNISGLSSGRYGKFRIIRESDGCSTSTDVTEIFLQSACEDQPTFSFRNLCEDDFSFQNCEGLTIEGKGKDLKKNTYFYADDDYLGCMAYVDENCVINALSDKLFCIELGLYEPTPQNGFAYGTGRFDRVVGADEVGMSELTAERINWLFCNAPSANENQREKINKAIWQLLGQENGCNNLCQQAKSAVSSVRGGIADQMVFYKSRRNDVQDFVVFQQISCATEPCPVVAAPQAAGGEICASDLEGTLEVTVSNGLTADWYSSPNSDTPIATGTTTFTGQKGATYYVEARDPNTGCVSDNRTPVTLTVNSLPTVNLGPDVTITKGESITLTAVPAGGSGSGYQFLWSTGATTSSIEVSPASNKTYGVTVTDSKGCRGEDHIRVNVEEEVLPPPSPDCPNGDFLWSQEVDVDDLNSTPVRFVRGRQETYTIPGPYPSEFNGPVKITINEAVAWDGYPNRPNVGDQPNEKFRIAFKKDGQYYFSNWTGSNDPGNDGLATGVASDFWTGGLGMVTLPNGVDEIILVHWSNNQLGEGDRSNPNSVVPTSVCLSYESLELPADYGDAPESYGSICYAVSDQNPTRLGNTVDAESGMQNSSNAQGDDNLGVDDEDGITFSNGGNWVPGSTQFITVNWSSNDQEGHIYGWIDFNGNGTFDGSERVINNLIVGSGSGSDNYGGSRKKSGTKVIYINVPENAKCGKTYGRFTIQSDVNEGGPTGNFCAANNPNQDGEVEDYTVMLSGCCTVDVMAQGDVEACAEEEVTLEAVVTDGSGSEEVAWFDQQGNPIGTGTSVVVSATTSQTYTVVVTDGNCTAEDEVSITVNPKPTVNAGADVVIVDGGSTQLTATASGGTGSYSYAWSTGENTAMISVSPNADQTYSVTVTDEKGCTAEDAVKVTVKEPISLILTSMCWQNADLNGVHVYRVRNQNDEAVEFKVFKAGTTGSLASYTVPANSDYFFPVNGGGTIIIKWKDADGSERQTVKATNQTPCEGEVEVVKKTEGAAPDGTFTIVIKDDQGEIVKSLMLESGESSGIFKLPGEVAYGAAPIGSVPAQDTDQYQVEETENLGALFVKYEIATGSEDMVDMTQFFSIAKTTRVWITVTNTFPECVDVTDAGMIGGGLDNCGPIDPPAFTNVASATGGNGELIYQWSKRPVGSNVWMDIIGANQATYNPGLISESTEFIRYARRKNCTLNRNNASNIVRVIINPAVIAVSGGDKEICEGETTTISVSAQGGEAPYTFTWSDGLGTGTEKMVSPTSDKTYTVSVVDKNGCTDEVMVSVDVNPLPQVTIGSFGPFCVDEDAIMLTGQPAGGTFSGPGVSGNMFDPAQAGVGSHEITYTVVSDKGCEAEASTTIVVNGLPQVTIGSFGPFCVDEDAIMLTGQPAGGTFSGPGVSGNMFDPAQAGVGSHEITYTVVSDKGCEAEASTTIVVNGLPQVTIGSFGPFCVDEDAIMLTGQPAGGTFSGPGVSGNMFDPAQAGVGNHPILYTVSSDVGCEATAMTMIVVNGKPTVHAGQYGPVCETAAPFALDQGSPSGGMYSGPGVANNVFDPQQTGPGTFQLTYTYSDENGCTNSAQTSINVIEQRRAGDDVETNVCEGTILDLTALLSNADAGGTFEEIEAYGILSGSMVNTAGQGGNTFQFRYRVSSEQPCIDDEAILTINVVTQVTAGNDVMAETCEGTPVNLFQLLDGADAGGTFTQVGHSGNLNNGVVNTAGLEGQTLTFIYTVGDGQICEQDEATIVVMINENPNPIARAERVCIGEAFGLTVDPMGGEAPYTYVWEGPNEFASNVQNPVIAEASAATDGTYFVTVFDVNGCMGTASVRTEFDALPDADAGTDVTICYGTSTLLTATGGGSYIWSTGEETATIEVMPLVDTEYKVTVTNENNCSEVASVNVFIDEEFDQGGIIAGEEAECEPYDPGLITGSANLEGCIDGAPEFRWQMRPQGSTTWMTIPGADQKDYDPGFISVTTQYRRQVRVAGTLTDYQTSNVVIKRVLGLPTLDLLRVKCANDGATYSVRLRTTADLVEATAGIVTYREVDDWYDITGIPNGVNIGITVTNTQTGCQESLGWPAPNCDDCPDISAPISDGDLTLCAAEVSGSLPALTVTVPEGMGIQVNWYSSADGTQPLAENTKSFVPDAPGTYYAEAQFGDDDDCVSSRTPVTLTILEITPDVNVDPATICGTDDPATEGADHVIDLQTLVDVAGGTWKAPEGIALVGTTFTASADQIGQTITFQYTVGTDNGLINSECGPKTVDVPVTVVECGQQETATLGDRVWLDINQNGQQDDGEPGVPGITVELYPCGDTDGSPIATLVTDDNGAYLFTGLEPGTYTVVFVTADEAEFTVQNQGDDATDSDANLADGVSDCVTLEAGETNRTVDAGLIEVCPEISVPVSGGDLVLCAADVVGPLPALTVTVPEGMGIIVNWYSSPTSTEPLAENTMSFVPDAPGTYYAEARLEDNETCVSERTPVTLTVREVVPDVVVTPTTICAADDPATAETDNLVDLQTLVDVSGGMWIAPDGISLDGTIFTAADDQIGQTITFMYVLTGNDELGETECGSKVFDVEVTVADCTADDTSELGDRVWSDTNMDGQQNEGEPGISGITVELYNCGETDGDPLAVTITDENGFYLFTGLESGSYAVVFIVPDDANFTVQNQGDDATDSDVVVSTGIADCVDLLPGESNRTVDAGLIDFQRTPQIEISCPLYSHYCPIVEEDVMLFTTDPFDCTATIAAPLPDVETNCENDSVHILTEVIRIDQIITTDADGNPLDTTETLVILDTLAFEDEDRTVGPLAQSDYYFRYTATDSCGNEAVRLCRFRVADQEIPIAICNDQLNVSLGSSGLARVFVHHVNFGSYDNCEIVDMKIRRKFMVDRETGDTLDTPIYSEWAEYVQFDCIDASNFVEIELRVTDAAGNEGICWSSFLIEDKLAPFCAGLRDTTLACADIPDDLNVFDPLALQGFFGNAKAYDNCEAFVEELTPEIDTTEDGYCQITRRFLAYDRSGNYSRDTFKQVITLTSDEFCNVCDPASELISTPTPTTPQLPLTTNVITERQDMRLMQNRPNPMSSETIIGFQLPESGPATLRIFSQDGRLIREIDGDYSQGYHEIRMQKSAIGVEKGILYYQLEFNGQRATRQMLIIE